MQLRAVGRTAVLNAWTSFARTNLDLARNLNTGLVSRAVLSPHNASRTLAPRRVSPSNVSSRPYSTMSDDPFSSSTSSSNPDATLLSRSHHVGKASTSVISEVIPNAGYPPKWPYFQDDFKRMDENDDGFFYMSVGPEERCLSVEPLTEPRFARLVAKNRNAHRRRCNLLIDQILSVRV
jgi:hypothetical protein